MCSPLASGSPENCKVNESLFFVEAWHGVKYKQIVSDITGEAFIFISDSSINEELRVAILKKAALYKNTETEKNKKEYPIYESSSR